LKTIILSVSADRQPGNSKSGPTSTVEIGMFLEIAEARRGSPGILKRVPAAFERFQYPSFELKNGEESKP
jgi:hypothetical protein